MNDVKFLGRISSDINLTEKEDFKVINFQLAVDRNISKEKEEELKAEGKQTADFFNVVAYGKLAETIYKHKKKGDRILIDGNLRNRKYEVEDQTRYITEIVLETVYFV